MLMIDEPGERIGMEPLQQEIELFDRERAALIAAHLGKFVVVKGAHILGAFDNVEAAYNAGVAQFGTNPFLVRQVLPQEPVATAPALWTGIVTLA